jgi:hypothetical protein
MPSRHDFYVESLSLPLLRALNGQRAPFIGTVGRFNKDYPVPYFRWNEIALVVMGGYWSGLSRELWALSPFPSDVFAFEATITLHDDRSPQTAGVPPFLQNRIVTLDEPNRFIRIREESLDPRFNRDPL